MPGFMATYIMEKSWGNVPAPQGITEFHNSSDSSENYDDIDFDFAGE